MPIAGDTHPDEAVWLQSGERDWELAVEVSGLQVLNKLLWPHSLEECQPHSWEACFGRDRKQPSSWKASLMPRVEWMAPPANSPSALLFSFGACHTFFWASPLLLHSCRALFCLMNARLIGEIRRACPEQGEPAGGRILALGVSLGPRTVSSPLHLWDAVVLTCACGNRHVWGSGPHGGPCGLLWGGIYIYIYVSKFNVHI